MEKLFIAIDGNSLVNRAYYAIQRPMMTKDGIYTQGIYGFLNMLNKLIEDYSPDYIAVAFDRKSPTFRHSEYKEYKAGRKGMPNELAMQMPILKELLKIMNIASLEMDGYEADDILGTISCFANKENIGTMIVTGDKDALQLATDKTKVLITKKGISDFDLYDSDKMMEVYGFTPEQFIDFKGLRGDTSDNIPGVSGIGDKTATKLILDYKSVEGVYENLENISSEALKKKLENGRDMAFLSKKLATIIKDVPIDFQSEKYAFKEPDYPALIEEYRRLELRSFLKRLADKVPSNALDADEKKEREGTDVSLLMNKKKDVKIRELDVEKLDELSKILKANDSLVINVFNNGSHRNTPEIYAVTFFSEHSLEYFHIKIKDVNDAIKLIQFIKESKMKLMGHDMTETLYPLLYLAYSKGINGDRGRFFNIEFDSAVAQYLLEPSRSKYDLEAMMFERFQIKFEQKEAQMDLFGEAGGSYIDEGLEKSLAIVDLRNLLVPIIEKEGMQKVFFDIELPLIEVLASMEARGFSASEDILKSQADELEKKLGVLRQSIYEQAGEEFNINSPKQLGTILFEKLSLPHGKKNKSGYSTDIEVLERLVPINPIASDIIEYRGVSKLLSTYAAGLVSAIASDGKIHPHFKQTVTATGRISCVDPNLQNIPIKQEMGRKIRKAFLPSEGSVLVGADYSQIELRVLAHLSEDESLIDAFKNGEDIHRATAARIFGVPKDDVTGVQRSGAKAINFGVIYGMSNFGLSNELGISRKDAEEYINDYFGMHRRVKAYMDLQVAMAKADGYSLTITGRKRLIPEINASNYMVRQLGERLAMNSPIQGSAADIIKVAMNRVYDKIIEEKLESNLILQIHDELIIDTKMKELDKVKELIKTSMEEAVELLVPLTVDVNTGTDWYELK